MRTPLLLLVTLFAGCGDPMFIIPGSGLDGEVSAPPSEWATDAVETIQVEFRHDDPYSVNIWNAGIGPDLYIATGADGTRWTPLVEADPAVRARIGDTVYELTASPVTAADEIKLVGDAYVAKYDVDPDDNWVAAGRIFRLDRR